ncbi:unnamed protein product [Prorocentrum cordatum]|uniref:MYND-type domain-containing protein n=1 Tax=Prorocentrum cordatum TaxID=2364126 RepID=A0ABN9QWT5_9DINO|nr:unnamed protein product [Polarella glacialis]
MLPEDACAACGRLQPKEQCNSCTAVLYCATECRRAHWPVHKIVCSLQSQNCSFQNKPSAPESPNVTARRMLVTPQSGHPLALVACARWQPRAAGWTRKARGPLSRQLRRLTLPWLFHVCTFF